MNRKVYIHIGTPKTGTSALQYFFLKNREKLKEFGLFYPNHSADKNHISSGHYNLVFVKNEEQEKIKQDLLKEIYECKDDVLLSSEFFLASIKEIHDMFPYAIVICYIKRPDLYSLSAYGQGIKRHNRTNKLEYKDMCSSYEKMVKDIEKVLKIYPKEQLIIRPYEKKQFYKENLFDDFLQIIKIKENTGFVYPDNYINASYTPDALEYKRIMNLCLVSGNFTDLDYELQKYSDNSHDETTLSALMPPELQANIIAHFQNFLTKIAKEYLEKKDGKLFAEELPHRKKTMYTALSIEKAEEISKSIYLSNKKLLERLFEHICISIERDNVKKYSEVERIILPGIKKIISNSKHKTKGKNEKFVKAKGVPVLQLSSIDIMEKCILKKDLETIINQHGQVELKVIGTDPIILLPEFNIHSNSVIIVNIIITAPKSTVLQIFYKTYNVNNYCKENSVSSIISTGINLVSVDIEEEITGRLRVDPGMVIGTYIIHSIIIQEFYK